MKWITPLLGSLLLSVAATPSAHADKLCDEEQSALVFHCTDTRGGEIKLCLYEDDDYNLTYEDASGKLVHDVAKFKDEVHFYPMKTDGKLTQSIILSHNKNIYRLSSGFRRADFKPKGSLQTIIGDDVGKHTCATAGITDNLERYIERDYPFRGVK